MGFFDKLKQGLEKVKITLGFKKVDENLIEELEEKLILSDVGIQATEEIIGELRSKIKQEKIVEGEQVTKILKEKVLKIVSSKNSELDLSTKPSVILMVGVNGAGKTTSIGKIANSLKKQGKRVLVVAGDTYRAAAVEQVEEWAKRAGVDILKGQENSDPASVIFDGCKKAKEENYDVVICDTAGRLQAKKDLMAELEKINRIILKILPESKKETLLVIDGTVGQNASSQLEAFNEVSKITGLVVTKLDGSTKGGIIIKLLKNYDIPIKFIGVGEKIDDMERFIPEDFVNAIID